MNKIISTVTILMLVFSPVFALAEDNDSNTNTSNNENVLSCNPDIELTTNGSFDNIVVTDEDKWTIFDWSTPGLGWAASNTGYGLEVQAGYTEDTLPWTVYDGSQYAEIDWTLTKVSNSIATVSGNTYKVSFAYSPRPHQSALDNTIDVSANDMFLGNVTADGTNNTNNVWTKQEYTFVANAGNTLVGFTDKGQNNGESGYGMFLDAVSVRCVSAPTLPPAPTNNPPTLILLGDNPMSVFLNSQFTDPGATATDTEDGDLTHRIATSTNLNTSIEGNYTITYSVADSKGASVSTNRVVNVIPRVITHTCSLPNSLSDTTVEPVVHGWDDVSLQDIFNSKSINKNVITDQKQYQIWNTEKDLTNIKVEFIAGHPQTAALVSTLGYYKNGNINTFTPLLDTVGNSTTTTISADSFGFAIKTNADPINTWATQNSLNAGIDQVVVYEIADNVYIIAFEDLAVASSDKDYNDAVFKVTIVSCRDADVPPPPPVTPTVSLTANPSTIQIGATSTLSWISSNTNTCSAQWTTATSTSGAKIVSPATTTEYIITCTGNGGSASATTTITVRPIDTPPVVPPVTPPTNNSGGGGGGGGIGGRRHDISNLLATGEILGATSCSYLRDHLKMGWNNDPIEMLKLKSFLNVFEAESLSYTNVFDQATFEAVSRFQNKYFTDILEPWGHEAPTGFVYILTKKKINEIYCKALFPVTAQEQSEIDAFRTLILNLKKQGVDMENIIFGSDIGALDSSVSKTLSSNIPNAVKLDIESIVKKDAEEDSKADSILRNAAISLLASPKEAFIMIALSIVALIFMILFLFCKRDKGDDQKIVGNSKVDSEISSIPLATPITHNQDKDSSPIIILPTSTSNKGSTPSVLPGEEIIIEEEDQNQV
ncbi:MAG: immunoglobulin-like domain-containing protein [Patescibacteria group bacterium]